MDIKIKFKYFWNRKYCNRCSESTKNLILILLFTLCAQRERVAEMRVNVAPVKPTYSIIAYDCDARTGNEDD